jgi:peptide deformylase
MKIITVPNPILGKIAKKINKFDDKLLRLITDMSKTLVAQDDPPGTGISAPQVGESIQLFLLKPTLKSPVTIYINPKLLKCENEKVLKTKRKRKAPLEGCLSVPKIWGEVKRFDKVYLEYHDETGKLIKKWFKGFESIIIQHEYDHLQGILFTQRVLEQGNSLYEEDGDELVKKEI